MTVRRSPAVLTVAAGLLVMSCASELRGPAITHLSETQDSETPGSGPFLIHPPPAQVLEATVVFFDPDGRDEQADAPEMGAITDAPRLATFAARYVDGEPALGRAAAAALAEGKVLVGGVVSSGCFPSNGAILVLMANGIRLLPDGLADEDPDLACYRAITSVALVAIDPADLPDATIQGT